MYNSWFLNYGIRTHGDWMFLYKETMSTLRLDYFTVWLSDYSFGRILIDSGQAPTYFMYGIFSKFFGLDFAYSERLVHMWPSVILAPIGAYVLVKYILKSKVGGVIGAIVYSSNTYFIMLQTGHLTLAAAYAIVPFVMYFYIKSLHSYSIKFSVLTGLSLAVCGAYEPRAAYIVVIMMFLYALYNIALNFKPFNTKKVLKTMGLSVQPIAIFAILNLYWIWGISQVDNGSGESILSRSLFGSEYFSLNAAMTLMHPYWNFNEPIAFVVNQPPLYFWFIPITAVLGLILSRKNINVLFFGILAIVGILLTKQSDAPFTGFYEWMFINIPGFSAFREASKFYFIISLSYAVLVAAFVDAVGLLVRNLNLKSSHLRYLALVAPVVIIAIFIPNLITVMNHQIGTTFVERSVPQDYKLFNDIINKDDSYYRIFWMPKDSRWSLNTANHPRLDSTTLTSSSWKQFTSLGDDAAKYKQYVEPFMQSFSNELLDKSSIKYVVVPIKDFNNNDNFFIHYGHDRDAYIRELDKLPYLKKMNLGAEELAVYLNEDYTPYISASNKLVSVNSLNQTSLNYDIESQLLESSNLNYVEEKELAGLSVPHTKIDNVFQKDKNLGFSEKNFSKTLNITSGGNNSLVKEQGSINVHYEIANDVIKFYADDDILLNDRVRDRSVLVEENIVKGRDYGFTVNGKYYEIDVSKDSYRKIGRVESKMDFFVIDEPLTQSATSQRHERYGDQTCKSINNDSSSSKTEYKLSSRADISCAQLDSFDVESNKSYSLSFEYFIENGQRASYSIKFDDDQETVIRSDQDSGKNDWYSSNTVFEVPTGAKKAYITLYGYPDDTNKSLSVTSYKGVNLKGLVKLAGIKANDEKIYQKVSGASGSVNLKLDRTKYNMVNQVLNPSLDEGLWQKTVSDCNKFDDKPSISMNLARETKGKHNSLELSAINHVACSGPGSVEVSEGELYQFSFSHQSPNSKNVGYHISFNDSSKTYVDKKIPVTNDDWHTEYKTIEVPYGATLMNITFYSYAQDGETSARINRYDDVQLIKVPNVVDDYFVISQTDQEGKDSPNIIYTSHSPTMKKVKISNVNYGFYLNMSEEFNSGWKLVPKKVSDKPLTSLTPYFTKNDLLNKNHVPAAGFLNSWYLDPRELCEKKSIDCSRNADGSYDIELALELVPQRYFNIGLIISVTFLVICLGYIAYCYRGSNNRSKTSYIERLRHK
ncbi:MAG: hypothetical protein EOO85_08765 [Pedobacter sp.]|nr:MAG: hypothetical protein EOO85_08765 [Pedobacter sp.]